MYVLCIEKVGRSHRKTKHALTSPRGPHPSNSNHVSKELFQALLPRKKAVFICWIISLLDLYLAFFLKQELNWHTPSACFSSKPQTCDKGWAKRELLVHRVFDGTWTRSGLKQIRTLVSPVIIQHFNQYEAQIVFFIGTKWSRIWDPFLGGGFPFSAMQEVCAVPGRELALELHPPFHPYCT